MMTLCSISVCEKFQTTRAKVAPVNFVELTRTSTRFRRKPVPV